MSHLKNNRFYILLSILVGYFRGIVSSLQILFGKSSQLNAGENGNAFFNFLLHVGPKGFWKKPTALAIGRSIGTLCIYIFKRHIPSSSFHENQKSHTK